LPKLLWRIYYDGGATFSNLDGRFEDAPVEGVLGIVLADETVGRRLVYGRDYYFILPDGTIADTDNIDTFLRTLGIIKFGRWTGNKPWSDALRRMMTDGGFPPKNSKYKEENIEL
jgi:hypothetical protein